MKRALLCLVVALVAPRAADAQAVLADYRITSWTDQDGLPPGPIWSLAQDRDGFLWVAADAGLLRFDGARFVDWPTLAGSPLQGAGARVLRVARNGDLWVGHAGGGVSRIRGTAVSFHGTAQGLPASDVTALVEDADSVLWAGTTAGLYRFANDTWHADGAGLPRVGIDAVSVGATGDLLVIARNTVYSRERGSATFLRVRSFQQSLHAVVQDTSGRLWVTDRLTGIRRADEPQTIEGLPNGKGYGLLADRSGNLWVATFGQGVWRLRGESESGRLTAQRATDLNGLSNNVIYALLEDREGNIWVGTTDGLNRLTRHRFMHLPALGLVTGLEAAPDGTVWAATADGLVRLTQAGEELRRIPDLSAAAMHVDGAGTLWLGTDMGLVRIEAGSHVPQIVSDALRRVRAITSDPHGDLWLHDADRGVVRWHDGRLDAVTLPPAFQDDRRISLLFTDRDGTVWMSAGEKIVANPPDGPARVYGPSDGVDVGKTRAFYHDSEGYLWVAGSTGLSRFANGRFTTLRRPGGLPAESLTGIIEDDAGTIWVGAASGILRVDRRAFDRAAPGDGHEPSFAMYDTTDGVAGTVGWNGQRSAVRTPDGRLWFLTASGVTVVDPRTLDQDHAPLPLRIEQVTYNDERARTADLDAIPPRVARLQIDYTSPNLTTPRRTRFRYRLEGFDSGWIEAGRNRRATYTNLPPGDYRFVVQARHDENAWDETVARWAFSVQPAFYETAWFFGALALTFVGIGWTAWRVRVIQVHKRYALLLRERARLGREIHDTLLQSLVGMALQCDALASDPEPTVEHWRTGLAQLREQVEGYIRECRQSIWALRSPALEHHDLPGALTQVGERLSAATAATFNVQVSGTPRQCPPRVEEQLLRIGQEAITNAARHAHARHIGVQLHYGDRAMTLHVADDGRGFDPADPVHQLRGHCGLLSMQERAASVGGTVTITSGPTGTGVQAVIPLDRHVNTPDDEASNPHLVHRRSPDRAGRDRADHQPAA